MESGSTSQDRRAPILFVLPLFVILSFVVFGPILRAEYAYDSTYLIDRLKGPPPTTLADVVSPSRFGPTTGNLSWRPLNVLIMMLVDLRLFGANPALSASLNLVLHGINAFLLLVLLRRARSQFANCDREGKAAARFAAPVARFAPWVGAVLFLVHPLNSEAVLCTGFRADLIAATCILACALLFVRWHECRGRAGAACWRWLAGAAAVLAVGLLTKEVAVVALVQVPVLALLALPARRRAIVDTGLGAAVLFVVFAAFLAAWRAFRFPDYPDVFLGGGGRFLGLVNMLVVFKEVYLAKVVWPWPLRVDYGFVPVAGVADPRVWTAAAAVLALLLVVVLAARREKLCAVGAIWYLVGFLPVSQIVPVPDPVAERFCYVPMLGIALLAGGIAKALLATKAASPRLLAAAGILVAVVLAGVSFRRSFDWRDDVTLNIANWEEAGDRRPRALEALGALYLVQAGRQTTRGDAPAATRTVEKARSCLDELLRADPNHVAAHRLYAVWGVAIGRMDMAKAHIARALELAPDDPQVRDVARLCGVLPKT
ncbi:MAG: hypothetical protein V1873_06295 [Verrucomicrobiota bacterium]